MVRYCKKCTYPENHPLGIYINSQGICSGCYIHEEKDGPIDWKKRYSELGSFLTKYKSLSQTPYDCIIPVNGNSDSYFVAHVIKKDFGLNPLLVTYNIQFNTRIGIRNLANLLTKLDCDHLYYTINSSVIKKITWHAMQNFGDMYWHCLAGEQTFPVQIATKMHIPLIVWGVNGWIDQVGMFSHWDLVEMTRKVRKEHALRGWEIEKFISSNCDLPKKIFQVFDYPSDEQLEREKIKGIYLGNFIRWDSQAQTEKMIEIYDYETTFEQRTFNTYETIHCHHNSGVHDYIKYLKYGYGKVHDHAARDIRLNRLTRTEAIKLILQYINEEPSDLALFLDWLDISKEEFYTTIAQFRDPNVWKKDNNEWKLMVDINKKCDVMQSTQLVRRRPYILTKNREPALEDNKYILTGRSYMDEANYKADR